MNLHRLWVGLLVLALLTPLGLLAAGTAWGEWGADELQGIAGFVPEGIQRFSGLWNAPLADYGIPGVDATVGYILSALLGIAMVVVISLIIGRLVTRPEAESHER